VFPISDFSNTSMLEFVKYEFEAPKYDVDECRQRGMTYAAPLKVTLRLIVFDIDEETGAKSVKDIKEQDVYMGDIPLMTNNGTFIVNGTERVIVSQMHRSPGVFFDHDKGKTHSSGKLLFAARIIPYRGSWLDIEFDAKDIVYARIDRRRKIPVTSLLYALGMDAEEILNTFFRKVVYKRQKDGWRVPFDANRFRGYKAINDLVDADSGKVVLEAGKKLTVRSARQLAEKGLKALRMTDQELVGHYIGEDLVNPKTGEIYAEAGEEITEKTLKALNEAGYKELPVLDIDHVNVGAYIRNTLTVDKNMTREDALFDIYRVMRPGEPPTLDTAQSMFNSLFFDPERYDLSAVGRVKMNMRLDLDAPDTMRVLRKEDIIAVIRTLVDLRDGKGDIDDIDHLGNRRVRSVGELMENQYRIGLLRMERAIKERMSSVDIDTVMPQDLINAKPAAAAVREFFGSSQLSQFMDQTNPLSEITHKRRLSALGPGGLTRERAGFEVRDVHPTHYGRICPIETPEGPNIGLINSLATYARVNKYGFVETPYRKVKDGRVTDEVIYLSAMEEGRYTVAQANAPIDNRGRFTEDLIVCRHAGDVQMVPPTRSTSWTCRRSSCVGGGGADSVPGERRRQPRADGLQHAAPGGAARARRGAVRRHRHGGRGGARFRRLDRGAPHRRRRSGRRHPHRGARDRGVRPDQAGRRHLSADEVPALEPEHLHQPASAGEGGRSGQEGRHHRRRSFDRARRARARPQRAGRLHAVERLQLRGLDPALRAHRQGRRLLLDPHRGIRGDGARHQARAGRDHPRHPERVGRGAQEPRRGGHRLYRRRGARRRHPVRQDHAEGREPDDAGGEAPARDLRREGLGRARHLVAGAAGRARARSSRCACSTATASRRTSARSPSSARRSSGSPRTATTSRRSSTATSTAAWPRCWKAARASRVPRASRRIPRSPARCSRNIRARNGGSSPRRTTS
jgi:antitoxin component of RelBE/YafQ-DinJ toxin-antitoxin module